MSANIHPGFDTDNWCRTSQGDTAKKSFTWTIEGFSNRPEKHGEFIESASFCIIGPDEKTTEWNIRVYPKGLRSNPEPAISLGKSCKGEKLSLDVNRIRSKHDSFSLVWRGEQKILTEQILISDSCHNSKVTATQLPSMYVRQMISSCRQSRFSFQTAVTTLR